MGYKETTLMDCGYFYCPYIDLLGTSVVLDNEEHNRIIQTSNEIYRRDTNTDHYIVIKEHQQNPNWIKEGF